MKQVLAILFLLLASSGWTVVQAQEAAEPVLRMELEKDEAIPGQPIILRVTVLVPTWMPKPPVYPSFEVPNVIVRLPSRASTPTSERIGGDTWSGIIRSYRLYPMTVGRFEIPQQTIRLTYADPSTREPIVRDVTTQPIAFRGKAPVGAEGLTPFIAAEALTLEQTITGEPNDLEPGGAVTRTVTAHVEGVSPIFLPPMLVARRQDGLSAYPKEPVVAEANNRGVLSGTRVETVTYVPEYGGRFKAPPIHLEWFNLATDEIEVIVLDGFEMAVRGDPPPSPEDKIDWQQLVEILVFVIPAFAVIVVFGLRLWPRLRGYWERRRALWLVSEAYAFHQAEAVFAAHDLNAAAKAISRWRLRAAELDASFDCAKLMAALTDLGRSIYGPDGARKDAADWQSVRTALRDTRAAYLANKKKSTGAGALPPLNPGGNV